MSDLKRSGNYHVISLFLAVGYAMIKRNRRTYMNNQYEGSKLPKALLTQLNEHSIGYVLAFCNAQGELEIVESFDNSVVRLGLINLLDAHVYSIQKHLREKALTEERNADMPYDEED